MGTDTIADSPRLTGNLKLSSPRFSVSCLPTIRQYRRLRVSLKRTLYNASTFENITNPGNVREIQNSEGGMRGWLQGVVFRGRKGLRRAGGDFQHYP